MSSLGVTQTRVLLLVSSPIVAWVSQTHYFKLLAAQLKEFCWNCFFVSWILVQILNRGDVCKYVNKTQH